MQSCHACIEATKSFDIGKLAEHPSVIILGIKSELKLQGIRKTLMDNGIRHVHFHEPDIGDQLTAIATEPIHGERRKFFRKYQLIKEKGREPIHVSLLDSKDSLKIWSDNLDESTSERNQKVGAQ